MYWELFKIIMMTFTPMPINPKLTRPDPTKNSWTFSCDEFKSAYQIIKNFYVASRPKVC